MEYFTSLNPPPTVTFTRILSGQAEDTFAKNTKQNLPVYLQDRPLQFKSCWVSWLCLLVCVVFAVWFAIHFWQERDFIWLGFGVMFVVFALLIIVEILEISEILHVDFSWRKIFNRNELDKPHFNNPPSNAPIYEAPAVKALTICSRFIEVTVEDKKFGEVSFKVSWSCVRIKLSLNLGETAVELIFYKSNIVEVNPPDAAKQIKSQLSEERTDPGYWYVQLVIVPTQFGLEPKALEEQLNAYQDFYSQYFLGC